MAIRFFKKEVEERLPLSIYNTLSKEDEVFVSLKKDNVSMYNCGPTVYSYAHIGNIRSYVVADIIKRVLHYNKYEVKQVINITDVGEMTADGKVDKLELGAEREGKTVKEIVKIYTNEFLKDLERLNIKTKEIRFTKATDYIHEQIALAKTLQEKGYTYKTNDGLYFDTSKFSSYGKLGNINLEGLKEGARIAVGGKQNPTDFVLWRKSKEKRQQEWESPWGVGAPGWHLECTAMIFSNLGKQIDIHTGGEDHIPIHHNNEIAQAEAVTGKKYVQYWLHNAFINIDDQKISKSLGNTIRLQQIIDRGFSPLAYRYWLLTGHYRSPINFTWEALTGSQHALTRLQRIFVEDLGKENGEIDENYRKTFHRAINDDFDTPKAVALLWDLVKDDCLLKESKRATMLEFDKVLGIGFSEGVRKLKEMLSLNVVSLKDLPSHIKKLVADRGIARKAKNWEEADRLRTLIKKEGYTVKDTSKGPKVSKE